jgi:quercetin dioxygenase-like cupin family protein
MTHQTTAAPAVLRPAEIPSHDRGGGARTTPLVNPRMGATGFVNGITEFDVGAAIPFHSHNCEESVMLLQGHAILDIENGDHIPLEQYDTTWIPANVSHRFRNLSAVESMKIFWTYASMSPTRTITATGVTHPITAEHQK